MVRFLMCLLVLSVALSRSAPAFAVDDLTVLHVSDQHVPHAFEQTQGTVDALPFGEPMTLEPYNVTVPAPSAVISSGDLNEFSGGKGWWEQYMGLWTDCPVPVYHQLGNHDNTWRCGRPALREIHGSAFYGFEQGGVKFIGWDTATPQDPRPSIAEEGLRWLAAEFERTPPDQPVIVFGHHALDGREYAGAYDRARLLEMLQTRNVALMLVGHGHGARAWEVGGIDTVMGGSTFGKRPGYGIVSIADGVLRVCHQYVGEEPEMIPLLEKPLAEQSPFLQIDVTPADRHVFGPGEPLRWTVTGGEGAAEGRWTLDGDASGAAEREGDAWRATLDPTEVGPGAHVLRIELEDAEGRFTSRTVAFFVNGGAFDVAWRQMLGGSSQSTPALVDGRVFVGDNAGALHIISAADGARIGSVKTDGEVRSSPALTDGGTVIFGSADGIVRAVDPDGAERWRYDAGSAVYGSPTIARDRAYVGTAEGELVALSVADGTCAWRSQAAEYAFERAPFVTSDAVFAGSWDRHAYALDSATGDVRWRRPSAGSDREGFVAWYYSPADCPPVAAGGNVFFADRAYQLTVFDAATGERVLDEEKCVAVGPSEDGRFVYVRHTDGRVSKRAADGSVAWMAEAPTGAVATPPVESHGMVLVLSDRGMLTVLDSASGDTLARQRVTPDLFAFAAPAFDGERIYVADMAGRLTCLAPQWGR